MDARGALLDEGTANRLVRGRLLVDDAPPLYRGVARALSLAGGEPTNVELAGKTAAIAAITARIQQGSNRVANRDVVVPPARPQSRARLAQLVAVGAMGVASLFSGLAAANALPDAAQRVVSEVLDKIGVNVPSPSDNASTGAGTRTQSDTHTAAGSSDGTSNGNLTAGASHDTAGIGNDNSAGDATGSTHLTGTGSAAMTITPSIPDAPADATADDPPNQHGIDTSNAASNGRSAAGRANGEAHSAGRGHSDPAHAKKDVEDTP
jgi:hypothetical protein